MERPGSPPAHSLHSDSFSSERRATALSVYGAGVYLDVAVAYLGGGSSVLVYAAGRSRRQELDAAQQAANQDS